jgi:hypothetical protein
VNKHTVIPLIIVLAFSVIFTRHAEANTMMRQSSMSTNAADSLPISNSLHSDTSGSTPFHVITDILFSRLLADGTQQEACLLWSTQYQRQSNNLARTGYNTISVTRYCSRFAKQSQKLKFSILNSDSENLSLLSPPGLVLRL